MPQAQEMKQYNVWKNLANIIQLQMTQINSSALLQLLYSKSLEDDKFTDDKLVLTVFCFSFQTAFQFQSPQQLTQYLPLIYHAMNLL